MLLLVAELTMWRGQYVDVARLREEFRVLSALLAAEQEVAVAPAFVLIVGLVDDGEALEAGPLEDLVSRRVVVVPRDVPVDDLAEDGGKTVRQEGFEETRAPDDNEIVPGCASSRFSLGRGSRPSSR
jgi:hypothetical protein